MEQRATRPGEIPVRAAPGSAATALAYRHGDRLFVTVIAKATFAFAQDAPMPRVAPQEILTRESHLGNSPARSLRAAADLAPWVARPEVVLTGHARSAQKLRTMPVRLGVFEGTRALLDKMVLVRDDDGVDGVPLVYERAYGGVGCEDNPLGVGVAGDERQPSLVDMSEPTRPACFGPIGRSWPQRRKLLAGTPRKKVDAPIAELPADFDWRYFQTAPLDQQVERLTGDEWIVIDGVHPTWPRVRVKLPSARARARIRGLASVPGQAPVELTLTADTLRIDADEQLCTLVFRGRFAVPAEAALGALDIEAGVETRGEPIAWSAEMPVVEAPAAGAPRPNLLRTRFADPDEGALDASEVLPFHEGSSPFAIPAPPIEEPARPSRQREPTISLSEEEEDLLARKSPLPFCPPPRPPRSRRFADKRSASLLRPRRPLPRRCRPRCGPTAHLRPRRP
ncbi:MAG: DUF2169 domain-containing protein [Polyangiaceae bacterium]